MDGLMAVVVPDACDITGTGEQGDGGAARVEETIFLRQGGGGNQSEEDVRELLEGTHYDGSCWCLLKESFWSENSKLVAG